MSHSRDHAPDRRQKSAPAPQKVPAHSVVVLDADPRSRALVVSTLTAEGYRATGIAEPETALRLVTQGEADLILADLALSVLEVVPRWERRATDANPGRGLPPPVDEGYAILRSLHADPASARHLAVFLRAAGPDRSRALRFSVVDYVPKPVDPRLLVERLEETYERLDAPAPPNVLEVMSSKPERPLPRPHRSRQRGPETAWSDPESLGEPVAVPVFHALPAGLRSVLVADADGASRAFLRGLFAPHGFTVHEAEDGRAALDLALARRPLLVISEINMPEMDGFELCRHLRAHALLRHTPLILYSGWDDYTDRYLGLTLGADEYLSKLTPVREILIRLQLILKRYSDVGRRTRQGPGMEGTIELIGAIGMLQMCHLGRLSGVCTIRGDEATCQITMRDGEILDARCGPVRREEAIYSFLAWTRGQFEFVPGDPGDAPTLPLSFDFLLLEGCRRLDEQGRTD